MFACPDLTGFSNSFQRQHYYMYYLLQIAVCLARFSTASKESNNELEHMRELYRREALQRKLLYNKVSFWRSASAAVVTAMYNVHYSFRGSME